MVLEQEWALQAAEKCYLQGEQKEEKFYQLKATHEEGGLSSTLPPTEGRGSLAALSDQENSYEFYPCSVFTEWN